MENSGLTLFLFLFLVAVHAQIVLNVEVNQVIT